ncbi:MHJ_0274 family protein [Mycoplasma tauri]|uniref:Uncharacterized protein n=1 Tax=Mycoplasma tauri TaxID=547987 RepID=A0A953T6H5_9MOLU|nr:hypothetical protein [Mycoplasma tauri]MBZ4195181.1 hypothetical protein [Mycoplasma tauri]MBZ4203356.1 hypothetical protein [Mycoplasma tauri]MBZ4204213.1 hypothetical protein [Mycoplasma tauri]MBZ4226647.1 hypothetical protein [Mycoplasma tauri]QSB07462.1 hypothetical protein JS510_03065 [Mycoplasma tauri]
MDASLTMWIILGTLILIILSMFIVSAVKSSINKKRKIKKDAAFSENCKKYTELSIIKLNALITVNKEYLEKFEPSIGSFKMSDLVNVAGKYLDEIQNDMNFREYIVNSDTTYEFLKHFVKLSHTRSNNWEKKCFDVIDYLNREMKSISEFVITENKNNYLEEIRNFYKNKLVKNESAQ